MGDTRPTYQLSATDLPTEQTARDWLARQNVTDPPPYRGVWWHEAHGRCHVFSNHPEDLEPTGWTSAPDPPSEPGPDPDPTGQLVAALDRLTDAIGRLVGVAPVRDLLGDRAPRSQIFGYVDGQDNPPDYNQVRMARLFLSGGLPGITESFHPAEAWTLCRQIVDRAHTRTPGACARKTASAGMRRRRTSRAARCAPASSCPSPREEEPPMPTAPDPDDTPRNFVALADAFPTEAEARDDLERQYGDVGTCHGVWRIPDPHAGVVWLFGDADLEHLTERGWRYLRDRPGSDCA